MIFVRAISEILMRELSSINSQREILGCKLYNREREAINTPEWTSRSRPLLRLYYLYKVTARCKTLRLLHSVRLVCATRSRVWPRHRSLRVSPLDLRRALRPVQTGCVGPGPENRLQTVRLHPRRHAVPVRSSGSVSLQDRLRRAQMREMRQRLLRLSEVPSLRLQLSRHDAMPGRRLRVWRQGTMPVQGERDEEE